MLEIKLIHSWSCEAYIPQHGVDDSPESEAEKKITDRAKKSTQCKECVTEVGPPNVICSAFGESLAHNCNWISQRNKIRIKQKYLRIEIGWDTKWEREREEKGRNGCFELLQHAIRLCTTSITSERKRVWVCACIFFYRFAILLNPLKRLKVLK